VRYVLNIGDKEKKYVLGLDISTSATGICILDAEDDSIVEINAYTFKSGKSFWQKIDDFKERLDQIKSAYGTCICWKVAIEEPLLGFKKGFSSAQTITTLMRFNGVVSYITREIFRIDPTYISASNARKVCGVKVQKTAKAGMSGKDQVFEHMKNHDLKSIQWPVNKAGKIVDWSKDATDAYCIAKSYCILNK
jgi:hypothetical protein